MREICNSEFKEQMKNLQEIPGVSERSALTVLAEIGPDVNAFPSAKHLVSWCGFNPRNDESNKKSNRTRLLTGTDSSELPVFNAHGLHQERKIVTSLSFTHFTHK